MAVVVAANGTDRAAAARPPAEPVYDVQPRLLMAARCGNSELLKNLLLLNKHVDEEAGSASLLPRVTLEGDTLLHVVAACGDGDGDAGGGQQKFLDCVNVIVRNIEKKGGAAALRLALKARNNSGDTPLHCAAGAGNANMISCLIDHIANNGDGDEAAAAMKKALVRMENQCGETALHQAVRAAKNNEECIDSLMKHDPELACVLSEGGGASPLYLAISLGQVEIAQHLFNTTKGELSYSGPDGQNVLHAAVSRGQVSAFEEAEVVDQASGEERSSVGSGPGGEVLESESVVVCEQGAVHEQVCFEPCCMTVVVEDSDDE